MKGKGRLTLTGQLGDVMKESAQAALSWTRAHARALGLKRGVLRRRTTSTCTCPEGAIPKDGPSAGITMATAHGLGLHRPARARRGGHDRRDHAARARAADRRPEGEDPGRAPRRHRHDPLPEAQQEGARRGAARTCGAAWRCTWSRRSTRCSRSRSLPPPERSRRQPGRQGPRPFPSGRAARPSRRQPRTAAALIACPDEHPDDRGRGRQPRAHDPGEGAARGLQEVRDRLLRRQRRERRRRLRRHQGGLRRDPRPRASTA